MNRAKWHTFQVLTKRAERLSELASVLVWSDNIWQGVTVENEKYKFRVDYLRKIPAAVKFISFEPLIGDVGQVNLEGIDWAIVGGESGFNCRPMEWIGYSISSANARLRTPCFILSNGAECGDKKTAACCWAAPGMKCRR